MRRPGFACEIGTGAYAAQVTDLDRTAVRGENGAPRVVYHGTSRDFSDFSAEAQEEALYGRAFYFTEDRDVARGYAEMRHLPPVESFDGRAALDEFLGERPDWEIAYIDEHAGGVLVVQFRNHEHRPQIIHAYLLIERPLDLDEPPPAELVAASGERFRFEPTEMLTARDLHSAMVETFGGGGGGADDAAAVTMTRDFLGVIGYDGLTHVDRRYANHHRVWLAFRRDQIVEIERELL